MEVHLILAIEDNKYKFSEDIWNWNGGKLSVRQN